MSYLVALMNKFSNKKEASTVDENERKANLMGAAYWSNARSPAIAAKFLTNIY